MKVRSALGAVAAIGLAFSSIVLGFATPASANKNGTCASGYVCLYENLNYNTDKPIKNDHWRNFKKSDSDFRNNSWRDHDDQNSGDGMDNETSSWKNLRGAGCKVTLYQHVGYGGAQEPLPHGVGDPNMKGDGGVGDNSASAIKIKC